MPARISLHVPIIACNCYSRAWSLRAAGLTLDLPFCLVVWSLSLFLDAGSVILGYSHARELVKHFAHGRHKRVLSPVLASVREIWFQSIDCTGQATLMEWFTS